MQGRSTLATGATVIAGILLFLSILYPPTLTAADHLDHSWMQVMGHLLSKPGLAGVDWVITYGPLGFLQTHAYDPELFWLHIAWAASASAVFTWAALKIFVGIPSRLAALLWILILVSQISYTTDFIYHVGSLLGAVVLIDRYRCHPIGLLIASVMLGLLFLMKFTNVLVGGLFAAVIFLSALRLRGPVVSISCAAVLPLVFFSVWTGLGNPISNLPRWLAGSREISVGYAMAQSFPGGAGEVILGIILGVAAAGLVIYSYLRGQRRLEDTLLSGAILLWLFLMFKAGFVRHDGHARLFFAGVLLVPYLVRLPDPAPRALKLGFVAVAIAYIGLGSLGEPHFEQLRKLTSPKRLLKRPAVRIASNLIYVVNPLARRDQLDANRLALKDAHALPRTQEAVGRSTVDLFGYEQGVVFLNDLEYHGRPVFQSYSAYTPTLLQLNADFMAGPDAPAYVLYKLKAIDERLPTLDDDLALAVLRRDYEVALVESEFILLRRLPEGERGRTPEGDLVDQRIIGFDQRIDVPRRGREIRARVVVTPSDLGAARILLYKMPRIYIALGTSDGAEHRFRLIPGQSSSSFLLSPLLRDHSAMLLFCAGAELPQVDWLRIETDQAHHQVFFEAEIPLELRAYDTPPFERGSCPPSSPL